MSIELYELHSLTLHTTHAIRTREALSNVFFFRSNCGADTREHAHIFLDLIGDSIEALTLTKKMHSRFLRNDWKHLFSIGRFLTAQTNAQFNTYFESSACAGIYLENVFVRTTWITRLSSAHESPPSHRHMFTYQWPMNTQFNFCRRAE